MSRERLDVVLVSRGLARSRNQAQTLIRAGCVRVDGRVTTRASARPVDPSEISVDTAADPLWVSRSGTKLAHAIDTWQSRGLIVPDRAALDVGASTGGFTQVLLHRGARHVVALDVGHGQLAPEVAADARVTEVSGLSVRDATRADLTVSADLAVIDVSFISLRQVLAPVRSLLSEPADVVALVKPQFEVGRRALGKGGVVRSWRHRRLALQAVLQQATQDQWGIRGLIGSPLAGSHGNREYLVWLTTPSDRDLTWQAVTASIDRLETGEPP